METKIELQISIIKKDGTFPPFIKKYSLLSFVYCPLATGNDFITPYHSDRKQKSKSVLRGQTKSFCKCLLNKNKNSNTGYNNPNIDNCQ